MTTSRLDGNNLFLETDPGLRRQGVSEGSTRVGRCLVAWHALMEPVGVLIWEIKFEEVMWQGFCPCLGQLQLSACYLAVVCFYIGQLLLFILTTIMVL